MIDTKYNIGDTVYLPWEVVSITITEEGTKYRLVNDTAEWGLLLTEHQITDTECISTENYEAEIDDLKDEISRLREMYQLEHLKVLKAKFKASGGIQNDSHHPKENSYSDEWRKMP